MAQQPDIVGQALQAVSQVANNLFHPDASGQTPAFRAGVNLQNQVTQNAPQMFRNAVARSLAGPGGFMPTQLPKLAIPDIKNPFVDVPKNIIQGTINQVPGSIESSGKVQQLLASPLTGQQPIIQTPGQAVGEAANAAILPLSLLTGGGAVKAAGEAIPQRTVLEAAKQGAMRGIGQGALYGGLSGLHEGQNKDITGQALQGVTGAGVGAAVGGVIGGALGAGGQYISNQAKQAAIDKHYAGLSATTKKQYADFDEKGLSLLNNLDEAQRTGDKNALRRSITDILGQPEGSPYDPYKKSLYPILVKIKAFQQSPEEEIVGAMKQDVAMQLDHLAKNDPSIPQDIGQTIGDIQTGNVKTVKDLTTLINRELPQAAQDNPAIANVIDNWQKQADQTIAYQLEKNTTQHIADKAGGVAANSPMDKDLETLINAPDQLPYINSFLNAVYNKDPKKAAYFENLINQEIGDSGKFDVSSPNFDPTAKTSLYAHYRPEVERLFNQLQREGQIYQPQGIVQQAGAMLGKVMPSQEAMNTIQSGHASADFLAGDLSGASIGNGQAKLPNPTDVLTAQQSGNITPEEAQMFMQDNPAFVASQARLAHGAVSAQVRVSANTFAQQAQDTLKTPQDQELFRQALEHPEGQDWLSKQASNPEKFNTLVDQYQKFTDTIAQKAKQQNVPLNYVEDYYSHIVDLKTPEERQAFSDYMAQNAKDFTSGFTKTRYFTNIDDLRNAGFNLKDQPVAQDAVDYANSMAKQISAAAYDNTINKLTPGAAIEGGAGTRNAQGQAFLQSNVPGNQGTFIDPQIEKQQGFYNRSAFANSAPLAGKDIQVGDKTLHIPGLDQLNQIDKQSKLGGGLFHALNTTLRMSVNDPVSIPQAVRNAFDSNANAAFNQQAIDSGVIDYGTNAGITFDTSGDLAKPNASLLDTVTSKNPITKLNNATFGGLINTYKINLTKAMMDKFPDAATNPDQMAQAQAYGSQINDLMGGINYEALGRNKTIQQAYRLVGLAPDFSEGTIRQLFASVNPKGYLSTTTRPASLFALRNVLGQVAVYAALSELGRKLTTGGFSPDFQSFVTNSIEGHSIPLPNSPLFNNPKNNKTQAASLPSPEANTLLSAFKDPGHFLQARGSGIVSVGGSLASGKDYYGNPLVDPFSNAPDNLLNRAKAVIPNQLPIPLQQLLKTTGGSQTPATALLNTTGLRVGNNPSDPTVMAQKMYFDGIAKAAATLNPNDQKIFMGQLHPTTKDYSGNPVVDKNAINTPAKYMTLLSNPKVLQAEVMLQQSQPNHDPLWDLPAGQRNTILAAAAKLPNQRSTYSTFLNTQPWYQVFQQQRSAYYQSLPQTAQQQNQQAPQQGMTKPAPSPYVQTQMDARNWNDPQVRAYLNANTAYNNNQLSTLGIPNAVASTGYSGGGGGSGIRKMPKPRLGSVRVPTRAKLVKAKSTKGTKIKKLKVPNITLLTTSKKKK